jgi:hypothetical protein
LAGNPLQPAADDGTLWVNIGDSYARDPGKGGSGPGGKNVSYSETYTDAARIRSESKGSSDGKVGRGDRAAVRVGGEGLKQKDLIGIPWMLAFALRADGWYLRQDIIWHKPNPMPESVRDRCTKAREYVFLLTKSDRYYYDAEAVSEALSGKPHAPGNKCVADAGHLRNDFGTDAMQRVWGASGRRNRRSVWTVTTKPYSGAHFAVMPADLVEPCIKAGCPEQCCPACGVGYERVTARQKRFDSGSGRSGNAIEGKQDLAASETNSTPDIRMGPVVSVQTLGWQPACDCAAIGTTLGTVLDPFAGSGTTLAVAAELGRSGIGCELNPEYIALAERRIKDARASVALFEGVPA